MVSESGFGAHLRNSPLYLLRIGNNFLKTTFGFVGQKPTFDNATQLCGYKEKVVFTSCPELFPNNHARKTQLRSRQSAPYFTYCNM